MIVEHSSSAGFAINLPAHSENRQKFQVDAYLDIEVLPPFWCNQARFYPNDDSVPTAMVTWALLFEDARTDIHGLNRALAEDEWNCGDELFFNGRTTPCGNTRDVLKYLTHNVFANEVATGLRRNPDRSVRRVNRWIGDINLRRRRHKNTVSEVTGGVEYGGRTHPPPKPKRQAQLSGLENLAGVNPASTGEIIQ